MKISKKLIVASIVLPLVLSSGSTFAFGGEKKGEQECRPGLDRHILKDLNLTDAQKKQFKTLRKENREEMKAHRKDMTPEKREEMQAKRLDTLNDLLLADSFDKAKATKMAEKINEKRIERQVQKLKKEFEMFSILTPEQKDKFVELQEERLEDCADDMPRKGKKH